jgi:phosphoesterase RecJ-like protein
MIKKIFQILKNNKRFLITAHMNLEGDALGSELAMYILLKKLGKQVIIYNNDPTPRAYFFLPKVGVIKNELKNSNFDVALVLDCSDSFRTGKVKDLLSRARYIINIDHHISNTFFGDINWVDWRASSVSEMIYRLCKELGIMNNQIALCLYTGIFTDTGNFTYANTTRRVHKIASELIKYKISPNKIYDFLHSFCEVQDLKFIGGILGSLKVNFNQKIAWAIIKRWPQKEYDLTEVIFSIMRVLKNIEVFVLFKKLGKHKIRVNFRSRSKVDVNRVAKFFGGGGHKSASGTTVEGDLPSVEKKIIAFIKRYTNGRARS